MAAARVAKLVPDDCVEKGNKLFLKRRRLVLVACLGAPALAAAINIGTGLFGELSIWLTIAFWPLEIGASLWASKVSLLAALGAAESKEPSDQLWDLDSRVLNLALYSLPIWAGFAVILAPVWLAAHYEHNVEAAMAALLFGPVAIWFGVRLFPVAYLAVQEAPTPFATAWSSTLDKARSIIQVYLLALAPCMLYLLVAALLAVLSVTLGTLGIALAVGALVAAAYHFAKAKVSLAVWALALTKKSPTRKRISKSPAKKKPR